MSYSCVIFKQNAAILPTKIQIRRMTMNKLSIIDGLNMEDNKKQHDLHRQKLLHHSEAFNIEALPLILPAAVNRVGGCQQVQISRITCLGGGCNPLPNLI